MVETGLSGRVALVTGCNNPIGIGAAVARGLAAEGVAVALACRAGRTRGSESWSGLKPGAELYAALNDADGTDVHRQLADAGATAEVFAVDLADPDACVELFERVEDRLGAVDVLVNNAAYSRPDTFVPADGSSFYRESVPLTAQTLDAHYAVNTRAPALLMAELHRRHLSRLQDADATGWGRVVNISTDGAPIFPTEVSYGATKSALESLSRSAAHELAAAGITVNIVAPGPIQTGWVTDDMLAGIDRETPLGRVGTPEDVADVVTFLVSEQGRWLTGQTLFAGGGHRML